MSNLHVHVFLALCVANMHVRVESYNFYMFKRNSLHFVNHVLLADTAHYYTCKELSISDITVRKHNFQNCYEFLSFIHALCSRRKLYTPSLNRQFATHAE